MADPSPVPDGSARPEELVEHVMPSPRGLNTDEFLRVRNQKHLHETRRALAMGLFWLVATLSVLPVLALILGHWTKFGTDAFRELTLVFTPVVALASAAFGFFFASDDRDRNP